MCKHPMLRVKSGWSQEMLISFFLGSLSPEQSTGALEVLRKLREGGGKKGGREINSSNYLKPQWFK